MALPEILTGMKVVVRNVFRRKETVSYPEVRRQPFPRFKGRHILDRHPDGLEKCIGCELCAGVCPADAIYVVVRGRLAIAIANPIDNRETVVSLMEAGDLIGEMAMLDGGSGPRTKLVHASRPASATRRSIRSTTCGVSSAGCASRLAQPRRC